MLVLAADPRVATPDRPAILDTPTAHAFSVGDDEFIAGTAATVAEEVIEQCCKAGAGNFAAIFSRPPNVLKAPDVLKEWYAEFGNQVIPHLRQTQV
jgi:hypothetical protein